MKLRQLREGEREREIEREAVPAVMIKHNDRRKEKE